MGTMMESNKADHVYVVTCLYGLEGLLADEVQERLGRPAERHWCEVAFPFAGDPRRLCELRLAGNVFAQLDCFPIGHTLPDLAELAARLRRIPLQSWEEQMAEFGPQQGTVGDICVQVKRTGTHNYTYAQVQELALDTLAVAFKRRTTLEERPLELRIRINGPQCRITGRLTPRPLSARPYKRRHMPAETDPTLAAAMVRLSRPTPRDVFLDPFCGSGTIPIERAAFGPAKAIAAGDLKAKCLGCAAADVQAAGKPVALARWDARRLPFADGTFNRLVTNPPQSNPADGRPWQPGDFIPLVRECFRVLQHGGVAVWLMRHDRPIRTAVKRLPTVRRISRLVCDWKGRRCTIHVLEKAL
jgi:23S rRNA G2445 N2-methylase RlmL